MSSSQLASNPFRSEGGEGTISVQVVPCCVIKGKSHTVDGTMEFGGASASVT